MRTSVKVMSGREADSWRSWAAMGASRTRRSLRTPPCGAFAMSGDEWMDRSDGKREEGREEDACKKGLTLSRSTSLTLPIRRSGSSVGRVTTDRLHERTRQGE